MDKINKSLLPELYLLYSHLNRFIRKSDNKLVQAKFSNSQLGLVYVVERGNGGVVIQSDMLTLNEFNDGYKTEDHKSDFINISITDKNIIP
jgi:hypothetical protein